MNNKQIVQSINWLSYIILASVASFFVYKAEVVQRWSERHTDFYTSEQSPIELIWPHIKICDFEGRLVTLADQLRISYKVTNSTPQEYRIVKSFITKKSRDCYHIDLPEEMKVTDNARHKIVFHLNSSIPLQDVPRFHLALGRKNSPDLGYRWNENAIVTTLKPNTKQGISLQEERTIHIKENCRNEPVYQKLVAEFLKSKLNCSCRLKHWPLEYDSSLVSYDICATSNEYKCIKGWESDFFSKQKKLCKEIGFSGKTQTGYIDGNWCDKTLVN